jgi:hypothetical protein
MIARPRLFAGAVPPLVLLALAFGVPPAGAVESGGALPAAGVSPQEAGPIEDNSFLIEEAYNQETGIVQHISTYLRDPGTGEWAYAFTQEWPAPGRRHQVSWTLLALRPGGAGEGAGFGDIGLNYRWMALGIEGGPVAFAPRVTLLFPTGDGAAGRGEGAASVQVNLPLSLQAGRRLVLHTNTGAWRVDDGLNSAGIQTDRTTWWVGQSIIYLARPSFNLMLEALWTRSRSVADDGTTDQTRAFVVSPGARFAFNHASGLQVVPGIAFPIERRDGGTDGAILLYLSFEHPFGRSFATGEQGAFEDRPAGPGDRSLRVDG